MRTSRVFWWARIFRFTRSIPTAFTLQAIELRSEQCGPPGQSRPRTHSEHTDPGRRALTEWLAVPAAMPRVQHEGIVKLLEDKGYTVEQVRVTANAFLRRMVRSIVALLLEVGRGRLAPDDVPGLLEGTDRALDGRAAPARGLTLERVVYEPRGRTREQET